jgi:hypothetical protein
MGPFAVADAELVNGKRVLKLVVQGGPEPPFNRGQRFADLNLYNVTISNAPDADRPPTGARIFAYSWTFLIPQATSNQPPRMFPYVDSAATALTQHNWDFDNTGGTADITIVTPVQTIVVSGAYVSGDNQERSSSHSALDAERNTTWAISCRAQPIVVADNLVTFWATDQNGSALAIFARSTIVSPP